MGILFVREGACVGCSMDIFYYVYARRVPLTRSEGVGSVLECLKDCPFRDCRIALFLVLSQVSHNNGASVKIPSGTADFSLPVLTVNACMSPFLSSRSAFAFGGDTYSTSVSAVGPIVKSVTMLSGPRWLAVRPSSRH